MPRNLLIASPESKTLGELTQETNLNPTDFVLAEVGGVTVKITLQDLVDAVAAQNLDAFGRLRVSNPQTLFDSKLTYNNQPLFWSEATTGGSASAAYNTNQASATLSCDPAVVGTVVRQTRARFNYQPGKSQLVYMTARLGGQPDTGVIKRFGLFDDNNGLFLQLDENGLGFGVRTYTSGSPVDSVTYDGAWSLLNGGDGTLPTIDLSAVQIFAIDYEWLGVGRVRFGFVIDGTLYWCHETSPANSGTLVYMSTPILPLRYELRSAGTGGAGTEELDSICGTVMSEGGEAFPGARFHVDRGATGLTATAGAIYGVAGIRQQTGFSNSSFSVVNANATFQAASILGTFRLVLNPTVAAGSPTFNPVTNSVLEYAIPPNTVTFTAGTGTVIWSQQVVTPAGGGAPSTVFSLDDLPDIQIGVQANGTRDTIWLLYEASTGSPVVYGGLGWKEVT